MKKICVDCLEEKEIDKFVKDRSKKEGYRNRCKVCENLRRRKTPVKPQPREGYKFCASCNKEKQLDEFNIRFIYGKYRPFSYCKACEKEKDKNRYKHECKSCGKKYNSGKKDSSYCKECHDKHFIKTYSILHTMDWSGKNNPMYGKQRFGKENPNYKPEITDEEREFGRLVKGYGVWRKLVYERDNYTCQCCGKKSKGDIVAHHLDAYSWCKDKRTDVNNGVTLCEQCHNAFHSRYGRGKNTKQQFLEFLSYCKSRNTSP
ncbi:HNH endonuclease [Bacillus amyloliquefaciens]|uniref:HNH endonuclease n=1 Tax=Bacillus amyloliquefaciens TaxID=1390 RepID=UPI000C83BFE9|nr:HNH endonuclease [Bacillus amyloliquefaciens]